MAGIELRSPSFSDHAFIPPRFAHDRDNLSPALRWSNVPEGTQELVLLCEDLDVPDGGFVHWLVTGIDPDSAGVAEGHEPRDGQRWPNGFGDRGWDGPEPPPGDDPHRYAFRLYALDRHVSLPTEPRAAQVHQAVDDAALASGTVVGLYRR